MNMMIRKSLKSQKGFTMVELMAVVAIIGILAAVAVPVYATATARANTAKVAADLSTIDSACAIFSANNGGAPATEAVLTNTAYLASTPAPPPNDSTINVNGNASGGAGAVFKYGVNAAGTRGTVTITGGGGAGTYTADQVH